jgi:hypothetical protein
MTEPNDKLAADAAAKLVYLPRPAATAEQKFVINCLSLALVGAAAFAVMTHQSRSDFTELIKILIWPLIVLGMLYLLRDSIPPLLREIGKRTTKLSLWQLSFEFSKWEASQLDKQSLKEIETTQTQAAQVGDSKNQLFGAITSSAPAEYALIYLESGDAWLTSRLFLAAAMLERMRGVRALVFMHKNEYKEVTYLGWAATSRVRWALASRYPWLEAAFVEAYRMSAYSGQFAAQVNSIFINNHAGAITTAVADALGANYVSNLKAYTPPTPQTQSEWVDLSSSTSPLNWERAAWITSGLLRDCLQTDLIEDAFEDTLNEDRESLLQKVVNSKGDFTALLRKGTPQFSKLIDRRALLEQTAKWAAAIAARNKPANPN